jgi:hypothetical protein
MASLHVSSELDMDSLVEEARADCLCNSSEERVWRRFASVTGFVFLAPLLLVISLVDLEPSGLSQGGSLKVILKTKGREEDQRIASLEFTKLCVVDQPVL